MPRIRMTLDNKSIKRAIRQVEAYKRELRGKVNHLVEQLTQTGVEIAKVQVRQLGAVYTAELEQSMEGMFNPATGIGIIRAGAPYAVYVEFGTGVVGKNDPHPAPQGWRYDVNGHGEAGWWYFNDRDNRWHWTKGFPSRPFMYNTARELEARSRDIAREVFGA